MFDFLDGKGDMLSSMGGSGLDFLKAYGEKQEAKKVANAQQGVIAAKRSTAHKQHQWNKEDIKKSFDSNYSQMLYQYAQGLSKLADEGRQANRDINSQAVASAGNADLAGSSFMGTATAQIDNELKNNVAMYFDNERRAVSSMVNQREKQNYNNAMDLLNADMSLNSMSDAVQRHRDQVVKAKETAMLNATISMGEEAFTGMNFGNTLPEPKETGSAEQNWNKLLSPTAGNPTPNSKLSFSTILGNGQSGMGGWK